MRNVIITLLLLLSISAYANGRMTDVCGDSTITENDTAWNAQAVMEQMTGWFLTAKFGETKTMTRNPENTMAQSSVQYSADAKVADMLFRGPRQKFPSLVFTHDTTDMGSPHREYLYKYGAHVYKIEITLEKTGHDSAIIYVDVTGDK